MDTTMMPQSLKEGKADMDSPARIIRRALLHAQQTGMITESELLRAWASIHGVE